MPGTPLTDVAEIADRLAIREVMIAYANAIDHRDWELLPTLFTEDAVLDYTSSAGPRGSVTEATTWIEQMLTPVGHYHHLVANEQIEVDGDRASSTVTYFNPLRFDLPEGPTVVLVGGEYHDRWRRVDGAWRICERIEHLQWSNPPLNLGT